MKLRTTLVALSAAYLGGWSLLNGREEDMESPAVHSVPPEVDTPGGTVARTSPRGGLEESSVLPVMKANTPALVRDVLRITGRATSADQPALRDAALHAEDPLVAGNALKALGRMERFSSDTALLAMTRDSRLRVRQDAIQACGLDGRPESIPSLELALADGDESVRPLVLEALGRIGGPAARAILLRIAEDPLSTTTEHVFARSALSALAR